MVCPLIVFDVGNSRLKVGLFDRDDRAPLPQFLSSHVQDAARPLDLQVLHKWVEDFSAPPPAIVTGSSPTGVDALIEGWSSASIQTPVALIDRELLPVPTNVRFSEKVGIDRLLNAMAANRLRDTGQPALVVDSGTATTVDFIDEQGVFQGGAILPGLRLSARALHEYTQLLPLVGLEELESHELVALGKETREAIRSGLYWGQLGAIKELTDRMLAEQTDACRLLTGGGAEVLASHLPDFCCVPNLSLRGFALLSDQLVE